MRRPASTIVQQRFAGGRRCPQLKREPLGSHDLTLHDRPMPHTERVGDLTRELRRSRRLGRAIFRWRNGIQLAAVAAFFVAELALDWGPAFLLVLGVAVLLIASVHLLGPWLQRRAPSDSRGDSR